MERDYHYATRGTGIGGLTTGIIGTALGVLNGGAGLLGSGMVANGGRVVSSYDLDLSQELAKKDQEIAILKSENFTNNKIADVYARLDARFNLLESQLCDQKVINAQITANLSCMQNQIATLNGLTKTVIPIGNVCPTPAVATTPTTN